MRFDLAYSLGRNNTDNTNCVLVRISSDETQRAYQPGINVA